MPTSGRDEDDVLPLAQRDREVEGYFIVGRPPLLLPYLLREDLDTVEGGEDPGHLLAAAHFAGHDDPFAGDARLVHRPFKGHLEQLRRRPLKGDDLEGQQVQAKTLSLHKLAHLGCVPGDELPKLGEWEEEPPPHPPPKISIARDMRKALNMPATTCTSSYAWTPQVNLTDAPSRADGIRQIPELIPHFHT
jgi:hypothetical protein